MYLGYGEVLVVLERYLVFAIRVLIIAVLILYVKLWRLCRLDRWREEFVFSALNLLKGYLGSLSLSSLFVLIFLSM